MAIRFSDHHSGLSLAMCLHPREHRVLCLMVVRLEHRWVAYVDGQRLGQTYWFKRQAQMAAQRAMRNCDYDAPEATALFKAPTPLLASRIRTAVMVCLVLALPAVVVVTSSYALRSQQAVRVPVSTAISLTRDGVPSKPAAFPLVTVEHKLETKEPERLSSEPIDETYAEITQVSHSPPTPKLKPTPRKVLRQRPTRQKVRRKRKKTAAPKNWQEEFKVFSRN